MEACESDFAALEENLYTYRDEENRFYALDAEPFERAKAKKEIVSRLITSCGPLSKEEILYYTRFQKEDVEDILVDFTKINVFSRIVQGMYCTPEDYEQLRSKEKLETPLRIIDHTDPFYLKVRDSIHGEEPFSPLVLNGEIIGEILYHANKLLCIDEFYIAEGSIAAEDILQEIQRVYHAP